MITSMLHLSLKYYYNYYSNFALWLNTLAAHNLPWTQQVLLANVRI